jgi:hypothetical protein
MFEAKPTAGGSGWPQLGAQLPPRGDVTLRSDRIGFGDCLICIRARARAREPVAAVAPESGRLICFWSRTALCAPLLNAPALLLGSVTSLDLARRGCTRWEILLKQGGGALGSYQAGVYEALANSE